MTKYRFGGWHTRMVDQPKCFGHYVTGEYIGTSGCSSNLEPCDKWLKVLRGRRKPKVGVALHADANTLLHILQRGGFPPTTKLVLAQAGSHGFPVARRS